MTFTVTYRDQTGAKRAESVEAESRASCVAACRACGISPLAIREGANGFKGTKGVKGLKGDKDKAVLHSHNSTFSRFHNPAILAVLGILVLLAILGGIWWYGVRGTLAIPPEDGSSGTARPTGGACGAPALPTMGPSHPTVTPKAPKANRDSAATPNHSAPAPANVRQDAAATTNAVLVRQAYDPEDPDSVHITRVNQELGSLFSSEPGEQVIPFPFAFQGDGVEKGEDYDNMNDGFLKSLKNPIEPRAEDSTQKLEWKRNILEARLSLLDGIKSGISVKDAIREEYAFRVRAYEARKAYIQDLQDYAAASPAATEFRDTLKAVNDKLAEQGIKTISADDVGVAYETVDQEGNAISADDADAADKPTDKKEKEQ